METTEWNIYVTPEFMYSLSGADYSATLTIGDNVYTITVPHDVVLSDGTHQWYPAVGLLGDKVYGEAQYLADQIGVENYTTVKFLSEPVGVTFGDGFAASDNGDGTWGVTMTHSHAWSFAVSADGATLTATCGNAGCPVGGAATVSLALSSVDKTYDGTAITAAADFDELFETLFPNVSTAIAATTGGAAVETMKDAGEYTVTMTVAGPGDDQEHVLSRTVTVSRMDISGAALVLTPATATYNGAEQTVSPSVTVGGVTATLDNHGLEVAAGTCAATEIGTYPVMVNGTGNFTGTATATWEIKNTTGESGDVAAIAESCGRVENNTLTVTNTTALVFSDGAWYAGLTLAWPMEKKDYSGLGQYGHAHYVATNSYQLLVAEGEIVNETAESQYQQNILGSSRKDFVYLDTTTWKVALTPAIIEAALAEGKTSLDYTMNAGAFVWGDSTEGDPDGVAFADYAIALPLDEPVVFALGEGEAHDLGATMLTTTKVQLAAGASVTSEVAQAEGAIFTVATGYDIVCTEEEGHCVYTAQFTHVHDWSAAVAANGYELVATCANPDCDMGGEVKMWLDVVTTEKTYDGSSVTRKAEFGEGFMTVYPDAAAVLTVNGVENGVINDAGEYAVALTVTGVGEGTYTLSRTVTVSQVDITGAALVLTPATATYNGAEQTVTPSVTVGGVTATLDNHGLEVTAGTCAATEIGTYPVTVNGTGNFAGTAASANWSILNTTGEPASVAASAEGSMTNEGNDFTLVDSSKLEYDAENDVWHAGITIAWPMEKNDSWTTGGYAHYVSSASVRVTVSDGSVSHVEQSAKFRQNLLSGEKDFTYLSNTTWRVALTPAIIEAALAEGNASLDYTMNAGAFVWGNSTEGDPDGVAFRDYTITIPLEGIALYDGDGRQVYPKTAGQTIIEDIKDDIAEAVSDSAVAESAKAKIDLLAEVAGEGNEQDVADWVDGVKGGSTPAAFFAELAQSDYVKASFELGTGSLITETSEVAVAEFGAAEGGFAFAVSIDGDGIEAARVKAAGIVQAGTDLDSFGPLSAERIEISESGEMTVRKDPNATREFFKIVIERDVKID